MPSPVNDELGWIIFFFALCLGIFSYMVSLLAFRKKQSVSLQEYLFSGNNQFLCVSSIVGSIFSVAVLYTAITALYRLYGIIIIPISVIPAIMGLLLLEKKLFGLFNNEKVIDLPESVDSRFQRIVHITKKPTSFFLLFLLYIILMTITEIAAFRIVIEYYFPHNAWTQMIIYLVLIVAAAYVFISGFRGVLITDFLQMVFIVIIVLLILISIPNSNKVIRFSEFFTFPKPFEIILISIGTIIICIAWFSTAPEIIIRIISLNNLDNAKRVFTTSKILLPFIMIIPLLIMVFSGIYPTFAGTSNEALKVWSVLFSNNSKIITVLFFMLITTAFFSTIDTYMITLSQINFGIRGRNILEKIIPKNIRVTSILIIALAIFISNQLNLKWNSILGVYAGCLMIPSFMLLHIYPRINFKRAYIPISSIWAQIFLAPLLILLFIYIVDQPKISHLVYPLIPLSVASIELIFLILNVLINKRNFYVKNKTT